MFRDLIFNYCREKTFSHGEMKRGNFILKISLILFWSLSILKGVVSVHVCIFFDFFLCILYYCILFLEMKLINCKSLLQSVLFTRQEGACSLLQIELLYSVGFNYLKMTFRKVKQTKQATTKSL